MQVTPARDERNKTFIFIMNTARPPYINFTNSMCCMYISLFMYQLQLASTVMPNTQSDYIIRACEQ